MVSRVVCMCGRAGAGKTAVARRLVEVDGLTRLPIDGEAWKRGFRSHPISVQDAAEVNGLLRARLVERLTVNNDVVRDVSFLIRAMRANDREFVASFDVIPETAYVTTSLHARLSPMRENNRRAVRPSGEALCYT